MLVGSSGVGWRGHSQCRGHSKEAQYDRQLRLCNTHPEHLQRATVTLEIHTFPSLTSILPLKFVQCIETYLQDLNQQMTCIIMYNNIITLPQHYINMLWWLPQTIRRMIGASLNKHKKQFGNCLRVASVRSQKKFVEKHVAFDLVWCYLHLSG